MAPAHFSRLACVLASLVVGLPAVGFVYVRRGTVSTQSGGLHTRSVRITNCTTGDGEINLKIPRGAGAVDFSTCAPSKCRRLAVAPRSRKILAIVNG